MRKVDDLSDLDRGAYVVREEIVKLKQTLHQRMSLGLPTYDEYTDAYDECIDICNECLDTATLGEIE